MFRAVCRSSSGAPAVFAASRLHTHAVTARSQVWVGTQFLRFPEFLQVGLLMMSNIPLETCWAFNVLWNNKFRYQAASCWLLLMSHTTMRRSINIKKKKHQVQFYLTVWEQLMVYMKQITAVLHGQMWQAIRAEVTNKPLPSHGVTSEISTNLRKSTYVDEGLQVSLSTRSIHPLLGTEQTGDKVNTSTQTFWKES